MSKKQIAGLAAATLAFIVIGAFNMLLQSVFGNDFFNLLSTDSMNYEYDGTGDYSYYTNEYEYEIPDTEFIGTVRVEGEITEYNASELSYYDHEWTVGYIDKLIESDSNKGLLLYIDSPGGSIYESDELYLKLMDYKEKTGRPIWSYMASEACSGGYYIAMASDKIYCNRNGLTGSIGVMMTLEDYSGFLEKMGIREINITSGPNKAMGSGGEKITEEQQEILQSIVNETYEQFLEVVSKGRNMTREEVEAVSDGRVFTPKQALKLNLIDKIATYDEMETEFKTDIDVWSVSEPNRFLSKTEQHEPEQNVIEANDSRRFRYGTKPDLY